MPLLIYKNREEEEKKKKNNDEKEFRVSLHIFGLVNGAKCEWQYESTMKAHLHIQSFESYFLCVIGVSSLRNIIYGQVKSIRLHLENVWQQSILAEASCGVLVTCDDVNRVIVPNLEWLYDANMCNVRCVMTQWFWTKLENSFLVFG